MTFTEFATSYLSSWGAGLSTLLACIKLWELQRDRRDRFRIDVSYSFTGNEYIGNTVLIRNLSNRPVILTYWELVYCKGKWPFRSITPLASPDHDAFDCKIEAHSTRMLSFSGIDHFGWGPDFLKGRKIFIRLYFAGKKSIFRLVYPR